jgi:hypothetical protein
MQPSAARRRLAARDLRHERHVDHGRDEIMGRWNHTRTSRECLIGDFGHQASRKKELAIM